MNFRRFIVQVLIHEREDLVHRGAGKLVSGGADRRLARARQ